MSCPRPGSLFLVLTALTLAGCAGGGSPRKMNPADIDNAVPVKQPRSRSGNPDSYVVSGRRYYVLQSSKGYSDWGFASWYGPGFDGKLTASGEKYDMYAMTAANKVLPLPSYVRVTALETHRSVVVKVNDRGPFHPGRIIDLSYAAATKLGIIGKGSALVEVEAINPGAHNANQNARGADAHAHPPGLYLQAGAFRHKDNARRLLERLTSHGAENAFIVEFTEGQKLYGVRLGPYQSASERAASARVLRGQDVDPVNVDINK